MIQKSLSQPNLLFFASDSQFLGILPKGALSVILQPTNEGETEGFILLASSATYAYRDSDRAWIRTVANKFQGMDAALKSSSRGGIPS